jgi:hypothetical protein
VRHEFRIGPRLADERVLLDGRDGVVFVPADHEIDLGKPGDQRAILGERQVRDGDDGVGARALEHRDVLRGGLHRIDEPETSAHGRRNLRGRETQTDKPDFESADVA